MNTETSIDTLNEIAARMTLLEFALEVLFARDMARLPVATSEQAKSAFMNLMAHFDGADDPNDRAIAARAAELAERFVRKVSDREAFLRAQ